MVAVFLPALVLMMVFVVDISSWWTHKRHAQLQADAAAFAGGDLFGECFSNNGGALATADSDMQAEATKFAGVPGSLYNAQIGGSNQGSLSALYNNKTYPAGSPPPDDTVTGTSCQSPYMFDVKLSEANLPFLFNGVVPGLSAVPAVNAHARVQLRPVLAGKGQPPLAIPDVNPRHVFVTLWNMTTGATTGGGLGTYDLCCYPPPPNGQAPPNNLNMWSTSSPVQLTLPPGNNDIGVRVGMGSALGSCPANGTSGGAGWACFDGDGLTPLMAIRGYQTSGTGVYNSPILRQLSETTCAGGGSPFFSDFNSSPCATSLSATVDWGTSCRTGFTCTYTLTATDQYGSQNKIVSGSGTYSFPYSYAVADGQEPVTLKWSYTLTGIGSNRCGGNTGIPCSGNGTFVPSAPTWKSGSPLHQQAYSADADVGVTGPIRVFSVSGGSGSGAPYSFAENTTQNLSFTVGLQGNLGSLPVPSPLMFLRVSSGKKNTSTIVGCDGTNAKDITDAFTQGCQTAYQINTTGVCPDSANPPDCIPVAGGNLGNTIQKALDDRFNAANNCAGYPVHWPVYSPLDQRLTQLIITDQIALLSAKAGDPVPVTNFGGFYITGWGSFAANGNSLSCSSVNDPPPLALSKSKANFVAIWGHFVRYIDPADVGNPNQLCTAAIAVITPCVAVLTK
jgi:hypothetical protein